MAAKYFGIPRGWRPITAFCIGYPRRARIVGPTRYPIEGVCFEEYWGRPYIRRALVSINTSSTICYQVA